MSLRNESRNMDLHKKDSTFITLPHSWVWVKLGEVCLNPQYGWTTSAASEGELRLLRTSDITSGNIDWTSVPFCKKEPSDIEKYLLKDGDIVISRAGSVGYSCLIKKPPKSVFASYLIRFKPLINEQYLAYFLKSPLYWEAISEKRLGIAIPNINASKLKQIPLPLPPLPEQKRIVEKIEELFTRLEAGVEALKKVKAQIRRYRQAVLKYAFEGKLTEEWRKHVGADLCVCPLKDVSKTNDGEHTGSPLRNDLPPLPEGWVWVRLGEIAEIIMGQSPPSDTYNKDKKGLPFYQGKAEFGEIYPSPIKWCSKPKKIAEKNDILLSVRAPVGPTNVCAETSCIGRGLAAIRYKLDGAYKFIFYYLRNIEKELSSSGTGSTFSAISKSQIEDIPIPLPPLPEQHQIVSEIERRFSVADAVEKVVDQSLKQAERLKQSILKKAFEGKLVPQDPEDEPAERLLERIEIERGHNKDSFLIHSSMSSGIGLENSRYSLVTG